MLAFIYVFTIWCLAAILYASVDRLETDRRLALVLKLLILAISAAATARCDCGRTCLDRHISPGTVDDFFAEHPAMVPVSSAVTSIWMIPVRTVKTSEGLFAFLARTGLRAGPWPR